MPFFVSSQLCCFARYQKILWECSFGCKNLLNFTCHTMKFHNCHQTNVYFFSFQLWIIILLHPRRFRVKSKSLVSSLAVAVLSQLLSILLIYTQTMKNCMNSILAIWDEKCSFKSEGSLPGRISTYSEGSINLILRYLLKPNRTL